MVKSGLIIGAVMFIMALGSAAVLSPLCTPCLAIFAGLGAGYLAGLFDKPDQPNEALKKGAIAGLIAGVFATLGQVAAAFINASVIDPQTMNELFGTDVLTRETLWAGQLGIAACLGLFNLLLMAGLGAGGGAIWDRTRARQVPPPPTSYPSQ